MLAASSGGSSVPFDPAELLRHTPYLIEDGPAAQDRFCGVISRAEATRNRAIEASDSISQQARGVLPQFEIAVRSDLVAESNRMEGIDSSPREVRDLARIKRELLDLEVSSFLTFVREDPRVLESLGLYRAYSLADDWARAEQRPREFELRQLHTLVMPTLATAGMYKAAQNRIGGSAHTPIEPWNVGHAMSELSAWFVKGTGEPLLDATVVHAWLTHIHPFDDGNGRMARLLANLALVQSRYPPLLLRSSADRGQYLDALAASDEGDILPLYDIFLKSIRRVVKTMERSDYVASKIRDELLRTVEQRYRIWRALAETLYTCMEQKLRRTGWGIFLMGYPSIEDFALMESRNADGNSWFVKLRYRGVDEWLLWFGYRSIEMADVMGGSQGWPSLYFSRKTDDPRALHRFEGPLDAAGDRPAEAYLSPGRQRPVTLRWSYDTKDMQIDEAAATIKHAICR
jgi:Fic family protein